MARRTIITRIDDLDGGEATETVRFALDGVSYEIDLSEANATALRAAAARYVEHGRKVTRSTPQAGRRQAAPTYDTRAVRAWAAANGVQVADRGRIPADVIEQFKAAGN